MADVELNSIGNGDGTNYLVRDNTKIPLSGTNALAGSIVPATDNAYDLGTNSTNYKIVYAKEIRHGLSSGSLVLSGGNGASNGATLALYGTNRSDGFQGVFTISSVGTNTYILKGTQYGYLTWSGLYLEPTSNDVCNLGRTVAKWKEIWCTQSSINSSSDERQKQQIKPIDNALLDAWENVNPIEFKWNDAVAKKGDNARVHTGYIAQNIQQALTENGVNPNDYGLFLYDEWGEEQEEKDEQGNIIKPYKPSGNAYGLRYTEALIVECAYLRKKNKDLQEQLNALSERLEKLENR